MLFFALLLLPMKQLIAQIKTSYQSMPLAARNFLLRALVLFVAWKLLYHTFLLPNRVPDQQLTAVNAVLSAKCFQWLYPNSTIQLKTGMKYELYAEGIPHIWIMKDATQVVGVTDGCNGFEVFVLYVGFLLCVPTTPQRLLKYIIVGLTVTFFMNVLRVVALGWLHLHYKEFFDIAHHYIFKLIVYAVVFWFWTRYAKTSALKLPQL